MTLADAQEIYTKVSDSIEVQINESLTRFSIPCDGNSMSLGFGGVAWNMDPRDLVVRHPNNVCFGTIEGSDGIYTICLTYL